MLGNYSFHLLRKENVLETLKLLMGSLVHYRDSCYQMHPYSELHRVPGGRTSTRLVASGAHHEGSLSACGPQATERLGTAEAENRDGGVQAREQNANHNPGLVWNSGN